MQYFGGKSAIAAQIAEIVSEIGDGRPYIEPFCGGLNVTARILSTSRKAYDVCAPLIALYRACQAGWVPPTAVSEAEYARVKSAQDPNDPLTAFVGFGCSFAGKYFGGYARNANGDNYALRAKTSLQKKNGRVRIR